MSFSWASGRLPSHTVDVNLFAYVRNLNPPLTGFPLRISRSEDWTVKVMTAGRESSVFLALWSYLHPYYLEHHQSMTDVPGQRNLRADRHLNIPRSLIPHWSPTTKTESSKLLYLACHTNDAFQISDTNPTSVPEGPTPRPTGDRSVAGYVTRVPVKTGFQLTRRIWKVYNATQWHTVTTTCITP